MWLLLKKKKSLQVLLVYYQIAVRIWPIVQMELDAIRNVGIVWDDGNNIAKQAQNIFTHTHISCTYRKHSLVMFWTQHEYAPAS